MGESLATRMFFTELVTDARTVERFPVLLFEATAVATSDRASITFVWALRPLLPEQVELSMRLVTVCGAGYPQALA